MTVKDSTSTLPSTDTLVAFLSTPDSYDLSVETVEVIETHGAFVFLAGDQAYKMKKPVDLGYLDFSTLEKRRIDSERELRLNKRTAPDLYQQVLSVRREQAGKLSLGGAGEAVEWLVVMHRFDTDHVLDKWTERDGPEVLTPPLLATLAAQIARLHETAEKTPHKGGAGAMRDIVISNNTHLHTFPDVFSESQRIDRFTTQCHQMIDVMTERIEGRRSDGYVRSCHGDLHLGNIVMLDDVPTLFDCIEFNDDFAAIDVLYDIAFLIMDMLARGFSHAAQRVLNTYLMIPPWQAVQAHLQGLALVPLFLSCRAAVRAHVTARTSTNTTLSEKDRVSLRDQARRYFALAQELLDPNPPSITAIGGLSGTGKSTLAYRLAPHLGAAPGAMVLRSDEIRKKLMSVDPLTRLDADAYTPEITARVYAKQLDLARIAVAAGHAVILDAVFAAEDERQSAEQSAASLGVPFQGFWLEAPTQVLEQRVTDRRGDASDADAQIVAQQSQYDLGRLTWHCVDASGSPEKLEELLSSLVYSRD